jgi:RNA polymerase sigma-70 factor (ECF subfamily)
MRGPGRRPAEESARPHVSTGVDPAPEEGISLSFEDFYEVEHAGLFGALCLITGNRHEAEELSQEAFLRIWERWNLVQSFANPTGYLYRTAMNGFRMRRRRLKVAARNVLRPGWQRDAYEDAETRFELDAAMLELTPRQRAAIVLTQLLGYSTSEAGETLGVQPATIRKLNSQARERMRGSIDEPSRDRRDG